MSTTETVDQTGTTIPNLRLQKVSIRNMMRLTGIEVTFDQDDHLVVVGGRNAQGKSSFLDGIAAAFQKGKPSDLPIHAGAKKGEEKLILCDDAGQPVYAIDKSFTKSGAECTVTRLDTGEPIPDARAWLDDLTARGFGFDPAEFARQGDTAKGRREQFETLRTLAGLDFSDLEKERDTIFKARTEANGAVKTLSAQLEGLPHYADAPAAPVDYADLQAQYEAAQRQQSDLVTLRAKFDMGVRFIAGKHSDLEEIQRQIAALQERADRVIAEIASAQESQARIQEEGKALRAVAVDPDPLHEQLLAAADTNRKVEANARRAALKNDLDAEKLRALEFTNRLGQIDGEKARRMKAATMPLPDLTLADDGETVLYQGKPLTVASSAEKLRVSTAIGIAMLRQLKVIIIRDGSFLDHTNLKLIAEMAAAAGVQVLVEKVCIDGASFVIEDGTLADKATIARLLEEEKQPA
jgi:hypothetical protein